MRVNVNKALERFRDILGVLELSLMNYPWNHCRIKIFNELWLLQQSLQLNQVPY